MGKRRRWDKYIFKIRLLLNEHYISVVLFFGGIIFSAFTSRILSEKEFSLKVIKKCLYVSSGINKLIVLISFAGIILISIIKKYSDFYYRKYRKETLWNDYCKEKINPLIKELSINRLSLGDYIVLQNSPNLLEGWKVGDIFCDIEGESFLGYGISKNPIVFTDDSTLVLSLKALTEKELNKLNNKINSEEKINIIKDILENPKREVIYLNKLKLRVVVITKDEKIVYNFKENTYFFEGNLEISSREEDKKKILIKSIKTFLKDKLKINENDYCDENLRILSISIDCKNIELFLFGVFILSKNFDNDEKFISLNEIFSKGIDKVLINIEESKRGITEFMLIFTSFFRLGFDKTVEYLMNPEDVIKNEKKVKENKFFKKYNKILILFSNFIRKTFFAIIGIVGGALITQIIDSLTESTEKNIILAVFDLFNIKNGNEAWINCIYLILIICIIFLNFICRIIYKINKNAYIETLKTKKLYSLYSSDNNYEIVDLNRCLTINIPNNLFDGWSLSDIVLEQDSKIYDFPEWSKDKNSYNLRNKYIDYRNKKYKIPGFTDGTKFMITSFQKDFALDNLNIKVIKTNFTTVRFLVEQITKSEKLRERFFDDFKEGNITFAHSLCLHIIILTSDKMILRTKRNGKTVYHKGVWSYSIEEQLSEIDFIKNGETPMVNWAKRALNEELGIDERDYSIDDLKIMSLFLEKDESILNCSLCGVFKLSLTSEELKKIINDKPRMDYEFQESNFEKLKEAIKEIKNNSNIKKHPTSNYRILMASIKERIMNK